MKLNMDTKLMRGATALHLFIAAAVLCSPIALRAQTNLVVPNRYASQDPRNGSSLLQSKIRLQEVYDASQFPAHPLVIREIRLRPSTIAGKAFSATISNLQINLSTTTARPGALNVNFATNAGPDDTVVFQGSIAVSSAFSGPAGQPKAFDIIIPLSTPFTYNPAAGNLLVDWQNFSGSTATSVDVGLGSSNEGSRAFAMGGNATKATTRDAGVEILQLIYTLSTDVCVKPPAGLVGWWTFDGNADDFTGNGNATLYGSPEFMLGKVGEGLSFDQSDDMVRLAANQSLNLGANDGLTIELWIKPSDLSQQNPIIEWSDAQSVVGLQFWISVQGLTGGGSGSIFANLVDTNGQAHHITSATGLLSTNDFQHIALTYDKPSGTARLYLNGQAVFDQAVGNFTLETRTDAYLGCRPLGSAEGSRFAGIMDEVGFFNRALTASEIQSIYSASERGKCKDSIIPSITMQPQGQTAMSGDTVIFLSKANGTPPLSYQWFFKGIELEGATESSLTLTDVTADNVGNYKVEVRNAGGSTVSDDALLAVIPAINGQTLIVPNLYASQDGQNGSSLLRSQIRLQEVYGASEFPTQPLLINEIRLRPSAFYGSAFITVISNLQIRMSTTDAQPEALSANFSENTGADAQVVFQGSILISSIFTGPANGPKNFDIVIPLSNPFTYDPSAGNLLVDWQNFSGSDATWVDVSGAFGDGGSRAFALSGGATQATTVDCGAEVLQLVYTPLTNSTPAQTTYDLASNFSPTSNPNGVWTFGAKPTLSGSFSPFTTKGTVPDDRGVLMEYWMLQPQTLPGIYRNNSQTNVVTNGGLGNYPPGTVWFYCGHESLADAFGVVRFTVPAGGAGEYAIQTLVGPAYAASLQGDTDFHVVKNGVELFGQWLSGTDSAGYTNTLSLAEGDAIDLMIGRGQDGKLYASGLIIQASFDLVSANPTVPTILVQPQDLTMTVGGEATFSVVAGGTGPLSYQWQYNGVSIDGAIGTSFKVANVQEANAGAYSVIVTNELGSATSREAVLTVTPAPVASLYDLNRDFSLSSNPHGVWTYGYSSDLGGPVTILPSSKTARTDNGVDLQVWALTPYTSPAVFHNGTTNTAITDMGQGVFPPDSIWFYAGTENTPYNYCVIRFTVPSNGGGKYWLDSAVESFMNGSRSGDTDFHILKNGQEIFGVNLPANAGLTGYTNELVLAAGETVDFVIGRGADGILYGSGLKIQVAMDLISTEPTAPSIVRQPRDLTVVAGEAASFAVVANGTGPLSYQWRLNGADIAGATSAVLALESAQAEQAGRYSVVVTNELGAATSAEAVLTVAAAPEPPIITSQPHSQTVLPGASVIFSVTVSSATPVTYQWEFNGSPLAGATSRTLSLANVQAARAGTYRVAVANAGGTVTSEEATLMLQTAQQPPTIIAQSGAVAAPAGGEAALWVSAGGSEPLTYQWFFNGTALAGATASTLTLSGVQPAQAGTYTVAVSNPYGAVTNNGLLLNVVGEAGGGGTVNFVNVGGNLVYDTDGVTRLAAGAAYRAQLYAGLTPETLQPVGAPVNIGPISGRFLGGTRVVPTVPPGQAGWFAVKVWESAYGRSYEEARLAGGKHGASEPFEVLTANPNAVPPQIPASLLAMPSFALVPGGVLNPPEITTQPQSQSVALGASVTLSVSATGPGALRYQWFKDENLLAGATGASLNISGAAVTDAGAYVVVVSNPAGSVTSLVATLTVAVERQLYLTAPAEVNEGDLVTVPLTLVSQGEVGGLTFALTYNPDALTLPEVAWDSALEGALKLANTPAAGRLQGVFAFGAGTVPAGTQVVAVISFRARTVTALANSALALEVIDLANAAGEPLVFGTAVSGGALAIASVGSTDNNANGAVDAGDATLLLRLLARLDTIRPWDVTRNDFNANGVLDSGDAIKLLRAAAEAEAGTVGPAAVLAERAALSPARLRAGAGELVTLQVRLEGLTRPVVAGDFVITYPAGALRLAPKQAPRVGALMAANALLSYSDDGAGKLRVVISSPGAAGGGAPVVPAEGVLAEVSFEVLAGAASQYAWALGLGRTEAYSDGYTHRTLASRGAVLIGRSPVAGGLGAVRRQADGQFGFRLSGDAGADYVVEASTDLKTWAPWRTVTAGAEGLEVLDSESATLPQRFYRVRPVE